MQTLVEREQWENLPERMDVELMRAGLCSFQSGRYLCDSCRVAPLISDSDVTIGAMLAVHKQLQNALTKARDDHDRERLRKAFPGLRSCTHPHFLAIRCYLDSKPEQFFDKTSCEAHLAWLIGRRHSHGQLLKGYLSKTSHEINNALLFLR